MLGRKLSELSTEELVALNSRLLSSGAVGRRAAAGRGGHTLMIGIPSLHEMVARELARRQEGDGKYTALSFIVSDEAGALTNAEAAAKATIAAL
jgi:hypothetical protein